MPISGPGKNMISRFQNKEWVVIYKKRDYQKIINANHLEMINTVFWRGSTTP
jgi:hypothetical protein